MPHGESLGTLRPLVPAFFSYVLSFVYLGIYWNNHHHMLHACHILQQLIIASQGPDSLLKKAVGGDWKGKVSPLLYVTAIPMAFVSKWISLGIYILVALIWLVPDQRIEKALSGT